MHHPGAGPPAGGPGILEERQVRPRRAVVVAVEQVVHGRVVLIDGLLHKPHPQHTVVELDVRGRVACDRGDVVYALELHLHEPSRRTCRGAIIGPCKTDRSSRALVARGAIPRWPSWKGYTPSSTPC